MEERTPGIVKVTRGPSEGAPEARVGTSEGADIGGYVLRGLNEENADGVSQCS